MIQKNPTPTLGLRIPSVLSLTSPAAIVHHFQPPELQHREPKCKLLPSRLFSVVKSNKNRANPALFKDFTVRDFCPISGICFLGMLKRSRQKSRVHEDKR